MLVDFNTIARGEDSGYVKTSQIVIENEEQWADLWEKHISNIEPSPPLPKVDFTREMVIAVFSGEKPTSGYPVEIVSVETKPSKIIDHGLLIVKIRQRQPGKGEIVMDVMSQPQHIIKIPKMKADGVIFEQI